MKNTKSNFEKSLIIEDGVIDFTMRGGLYLYECKDKRAKFLQIPLEKEYKQLTFVIDYPFGKKHTFKIKNVKLLSDILFPLYDQFQMMYKNWVKFGGYNHALTDLSIDHIILREKKPCQLLLSS